MSALVLVLALLGQGGSAPLAPLEGVWMDPHGVPVEIGEGRIEWETEDRYYSAGLQLVEDGSFLGQYSAGRQLRTDVTMAIGGGRYIPGVYPDPQSFGSPFGDVRLTFTRTDARNRPAVVRMDVTPRGSRTPVSGSIFRVQSLDQLSVEGTYADKDLQLTLEDEGGPDGSLRGSLTYLGVKRKVTGKRFLGRSAIDLTDTSRNALVGTGFVVWSPSPDRTEDIFDRKASATDRVTVFFKFNDGSTGAGIHKNLKRNS